MKLLLPMSVFALVLVGCAPETVALANQSGGSSQVSQQGFPKLADLPEPGKTNVASLQLTPTRTTLKPKSTTLERAVFAGGCFWCVEGRFRSVDGVFATLSGYTQGKVQDPTYEMVVSGTTGHTEAVVVEFDPAIVSYKTLVEMFMSRFHNPTTLNRQGPDRGTQYRSGVYYLTIEQRAIAAEVFASHQKKLVDPIVTELKPSVTFWPAEDYHQIYNEKTGKRPNPVEPSRLREGS